MTIMARAKLMCRKQQLESTLSQGNSAQIIAARELLRLSLVEMYELGYWREHPSQFKGYLRLYRAAGTLRFNAPASKSAPDKTAQYIP
ncbi:MAG: hypothetical protein ACK4ZE_04155 [Sphingorhabdus sp.]